MTSGQTTPGWPRRRRIRNEPCVHHTVTRRSLPEPPDGENLGLEKWPDEDQVLGQFWIRGGPCVVDLPLPPDFPNTTADSDATTDTSTAASTNTNTNTNTDTSTGANTKTKSCTVPQQGRNHPRLQTHDKQTTKQTTQKS